MMLKRSVGSNFLLGAALMALGAQSLFAADGRIAVVADGNYRDTDDVCGTPVSLAILHSFDVADKLVHYSHSCDITPAGSDAGQGQEAEREKNMQISCEGTADRWGAFPNVTHYFNCKSEYSAAVADLTAAINASSASDLLYIIEAGEPDVIYDAMVAADQAKRSFVRIVTHHPNNDNGDLHDLSDVEALAGFSSSEVLRIPDQNTELKKDLSTWNWARDHEDARITWLWDRGKVAQDTYWNYNGIIGYFDCSDAGMIWYWASDGDQNCTMADLKTAFTTYVANNPIVGAAEAEDATISSGEIKSSFNVSGQSYVDGAEGFNLTWNFNGTAAEYDLSFFISAPSGTRSMGVFINGSKVGAVSASTSWVKQTVTANLVQGDNTIELRDSESTTELNVDMLMLTSDTGSGTFSVPQEQIYNEAGGLVIMEMENTESPLGQWVKIESGDANYVSGTTGSGHLEFTGNTINGGDPASPLTYKFHINQGGTYYLHLRGRKRLAGAEWDKCNDAYIRLDGDYTSGSTFYPTSTLTQDTKQYLPSPTPDHGSINWEWASDLDGNGADHKPAIYELKAGETYTFTVSGRSIRYNIDRIVLRRSNVTAATAQNPSLPESAKIALPADYTYIAITDFPTTTGGGRIPYYSDNGNNALAIDAAVVANRTGFARATRTFNGAGGVYQVRITTLTEEDGESTYRILVNGTEVATYQNPFIYTGPDSPLDMQPNEHVWNGVNLENGDTLSIESNCDTNGDVPENGGTAWSRGRWRSIELFTAGSLPISFKKASDLLLAQFDSKPDADDVMAQAALGCMLAHPDLSGVNYYGVAGAVGTQTGTYIDTTSLFELGFGAENVTWTDAHDNWSASVTRVKDKVQPILQAGGKVWVQEAGQSDFSADWIAALITAGVSESVIKDNVIVVQHSQWNEDKTTVADLIYVQDKATYQQIDDGNADPGDYSSRAYRGPETPNYVDAASSWLASATSASNQNPTAKALWTEADAIIDASGFNAGYSVIPGGGVDFSDCVENWWIFDIGSNAGTLSAFWTRYVTTSLGGVVTMDVLGSPETWTTATIWDNDQAPISGLNYVVPSTGNLISPDGNVAFAGDSLTVEMGGKVQVRGKASNGTITTIDDLRFTGGTSTASETTAANLSAGNANPEVNQIAGTIQNSGVTRVNGHFGGSAAARSLRILSTISGDGTLHCSASNAASDTNLQFFVENSANTFSGLWESHRGILRFSNGDAVGAASIEVLATGALAIEGNWDGLANNASLTVADAATALVDLGSNVWKVDSLMIGSSNVLTGFTYDAAALNAIGAAVFIGSGSIQVGPAYIPPSLIAHWPMNEGVGTTTADASGSGSDGLVDGATWMTNGVGNRATYLQFDGTNDRVDPSLTFATLSQADASSWAFWVKADIGQTEGNGIIVGNRKDGAGAEIGPGTRNFLKITPRGRFNFHQDTGKDKTFTAFTADEWTHFAFSRVGDQLTVYTNGVAVPTVTISSLAATPTGAMLPFYIGGEPGQNATEYFAGGIDDVRIYNYALNATEVVDIMNDDGGTEPVDPPVIDFGMSSGDLSFSWTEGGFKLQTMTNDLTSGEWFDYPSGDTSPVDIIPTHAAGFFRLIEQ